MDELINLIEINAGRTRSTRFNGALIGGLAGLLLHFGQLLLRIG